MSRIYFHTRDDGTAEIPGPERAYFGSVCVGMMLNALEYTLQEKPDRPALIRRVWPKDHYLFKMCPTTTYEQGERFEEMARVALSVSLGLRLDVDGERIDPFVLALNTALVAGSDFVKLAARLHGQCELHAYIERHNTGWMIDIIERGLEAGFLRFPREWRQVCWLLRAARGRVVTSYSVCDPFPDYGVVSYAKIEIDQDDWYDLDADRQWDTAIEGLLALNERNPLEITPDTWGSFYFGSGWNAYKLARHLEDLPL